MTIAKVETISSVPKVVSAWTEPIKIVEQSKPVEKVLKTSFLIEYYFTTAASVMIFAVKPSLRL